MKNVLMVTDGLFHPPLRARSLLHSALAELEGFGFSQIRSLERLPADLETYAAVVLYFHHKKISKTALARLDAFVSAGGGLLGVHSATASFKAHSHYFEILGGRFSGHGAVEKFTVTPAGRTDVFSNIPAFEVLDELYLHELQPGVKVHFSANHQGEEVPAVWTYWYGAGQVCYAAPGHCATTFNNQAYRQLLQQGLKWVAGG